MTNKVFVGNLSFNITESHLKEVFAPHGAVKDVHLMIDKISGRSRGFAFVEMLTMQDANAAIAALQGKEIEGRVLKVDYARREHSRRNHIRHQAGQIKPEARGDEGNPDTDAG